MNKVWKLQRRVWIVAAVFALQGLAAGFCAIPASAHTMAHGTKAVYGDCARAMPSAATHPSPSDSGQHACAHCDMPDEATGGVALAMAEGVSLAAAVPLLLATRAPQHILLLAERILAPPGSAFLLFRTSSRLLI